MDIVGGFILAAFCFFIFRDENSRRDFIPNRKIGVYYAVGSSISFAVAFAASPWTSVLLWPAISLAIAAAGYWGWGAAIYGKTDGRLPWSTRLIMAPVRFGQYLSLLYYRRRCDAWSEVEPRVWLGAQLSPREAVQAREVGVTAVLDLTAEFSASKPFRDLSYCNIPVLDLTELSAGQLREAVDFIMRHEESGIVYVHCKVGYSRSAAVLGAYLVASGQAANRAEALEILRRARPGIIFRPEVSVALEKFCFPGEMNLLRIEKPLVSSH